MNFKLLLVGFLALVLLGFYFYAIKLEIDVARECREEAAAVGAEKPKPSESCVNARKKSGNIGFILSGVGGLIAAFAVTALAVTDPGGTPNKGLTDPGIKGLPETIAKIIPIAFVMTWLISGLLAIVYSFFMEYNGSAPLNEMAKAWFGTVLAGVGAWFGVSPKKPDNPTKPG